MIQNRLLWGESFSKDFMRGLSSIIASPQLNSFNEKTLNHGNFFGLFSVPLCSLTSCIPLKCIYMLGPILSSQVKCWNISIAWNFSPFVFSTHLQAHVNIFSVSQKHAHTFQKNRKMSPDEGSEEAWSPHQEIPYASVPRRLRTVWMCCMLREAGPTWLVLWRFRTNCVAL